MNSVFTQLHVTCLPVLGFFHLGDVAMNVCSLNSYENITIDVLQPRIVVFCKIHVFVVSANIRDSRYCMYKYFQVFEITTSKIAIRRLK